MRRVIDHRARPCTASLVLLARLAAKSTRVSYHDGMTHAPLTHLSEEETLFRDQVHAFARERIAPLVSTMDRTATVDLSVIQGLFELGVMGIEVPEAYGGSGATFFTAIL